MLHLQKVAQYVENFGKNIILIGFMGSGKSTVGKLLAKKLGHVFVDMDQVIEKQEGRSITDIFQTEGEQHFRKLERELLSSFTANQGLVISTGGGVPCFENNMNLINALGKSIYLQLSPKKLAERLKNEKNSRPLIKSMNDDELLLFIEKKLAERELYYLQSKLILPISEQSASEIVSLV